MGRGRCRVEQRGSAFGVEKAAEGVRARLLASGEPQDGSGGRKVVLLRVAADAGSGGVQGPLFEDGTFEYLPIPEGLGHARTYGELTGRHGRALAEYFPPSRRERMAGQAAHHDPEFETFTYGDPTPPKGGLRHLKAGDLLVFYCGLEGWGFASPPALYLLGYFEVALAGLAPWFDEATIRSKFAANHHVLQRSVRPLEWPRLVLVKGGPGSRLLRRAHRISAVGRDRLGKPLKILSDEMRSIFGDFGGHVSIQRSPPRWVSSEHTERAAAFVRALE